MPGLPGMWKDLVFVLRALFTGIRSCEESAFPPATRQRGKCPSCGERRATMEQGATLGKEIPEVDVGKCLAFVSRSVSAWQIFFPSHSRQRRCALPVLLEFGAM